MVLLLMKTILNVKHIINYYCVNINSINNGSNKWMIMVMIIVVLLLLLINQIIIKCV